MPNEGSGDNLLQPYTYQDGNLVPYRNDNTPAQALNRLKDFTGITDIQEARAALSRGEYLPALGQGAAGLSQLGGLALGPISIGEALPASAASLARAAELGLPASRAKELGIFGGRGAMMSPRTAFESGSEISKYPAELSGKPPARAYDSTGWFKGPDSQWRFTISDAGARLNTEAMQQNPYNSELWGLPYSKETKSLGDLLHHPDLFDAYPDLANIKVQSTHMFASLEGLRGYYDPKSDIIGLTGGRPEEMMSTLLHEVQHAVQFREGFARGGNAQEFLPPKFEEAYKTLRDRWNNLESLFRNQDANPYTVKEALKNQIEGQDLRKYHQEELAKIPPDILDRARDIVRDLLPMDRARNWAHEQYLNLAGEVESRTVQEQFARQDWSRLPWEYEGYVPVKNQIVKFGVFPVDHDPFK